MRRLALALLLFAIPCAGASAAEPEAVRIENARSFDLVSSITGDRLRISVWKPSGPVPAKGFPVLYAFDGDESFGMLSDLAAGLAPAARRAGLRPAIVVAIGYLPGEGTINRRTYDLTPKAEHYVMPQRPNGQPWPKLGGGDDFLDTIEKDVKPLVAGNYPVDATAETLFGHSLGGLMTLHVLTSRPGSFDRYFASSPSLWVNDRRLLRDMEAFLASVGTSPTRIPLRLTVGSEEEVLSPWDLRSGGDPAVRETWVKGNRMVGNARDLAALIEAKGREKLDFRFEVLDGFDHGSSRLVAAARAIRFAIEGD